MAVFLSKNSYYPYNVISVEGEFRNPIELDKTKNADDNRDRDMIKVYIIISGENVSYLRIFTDNQIIPGMSILIAKDIQGNPGKFDYVQEWTNLNAIDEGRNLAIPIWLKLIVDKNIPYGLYENNLLTIEYR